MKRKSLCTFLLCLVLLIIGCAGNTSPQKVIIIPRKLVIGVIGEIPKIRETNVEFRSLTLNQLNSDLDKDIHALFIMRNHQRNASSSKYHNFYSNYDKPIFFIGTEKGLAVYINPEISYDEYPSDESKMYTHDIYHLGRSDEQQFPFGLYNDVESVENLLSMYSEILKQTLDLGVLNQVKIPGEKYVSFKKDYYTKINKRGCLCSSLSQTEKQRILAAF